MTLGIDVISVIYGFIKDILGWVLKKIEKKDSTEIVRIRQKWKEEILRNLHWIDDYVGYGEAIIRDTKRVDTYPHVDAKGKRISPWFRVGLLGIYHKGLQVGLRIEGLTYEKAEGRWRYSGNNEKPDVNAFLVGRIPFERIINIDWKGDEYYSIPHVYCRFVNKLKEPYEEVLFCEKRQNGQFVYYSELATYKHVQNFSKKMKK